MSRKVASLLTLVFGVGGFLFLVGCIHHSIAIIFMAVSWASGMGAGFILGLPDSSSIPRDGNE